LIGVQGVELVADRNDVNEQTTAVVNDLRRLAVGEMRALDEAIESVGSVRAPKLRPDRGTLPVQGLPIFNPATLTFGTT